MRIIVVLGWREHPRTSRWKPSVRHNIQMTSIYFYSTAWSRACRIPPEKCALPYFVLRRLKIAGRSESRARVCGIHKTASAHSIISRNCCHAFIGSDSNSTQSTIPTLFHYRCNVCDTEAQFVALQITWHPIKFTNCSQEANWQRP